MRVPGLDTLGRPDAFIPAHRHFLVRDGTPWDRLLRCRKPLCRPGGTEGSNPSPSAFSKAIPLSIPKRAEGLASPFALLLLTLGFRSFCFRPVVDRGQNRLQASHSVLLHAWQHMTVAVQSQADTRVAEPLRHDSGMDPKPKELAASPFSA
jgi:hypothetical protein